MKMNFLVLFFLMFSCRSNKKILHVSDDHQEVMRHLRSGYSFDDSFRSKWRYKSDLNKDFRAEFFHEGKFGDQYHFIGASESMGATGDYMDREDLVEQAKLRALIKLLETVTNNLELQKKVNSTHRSNHLSKTLKTSVTLRGIKKWSLNFDEYQCIVNKVPMADLKYHFKRECRVILKVPEATFNNSLKN